MGPGCCALYLESRLSDGNGNLILVKYYSLKTVPDHYLLDLISASMHAIDCVKRVLLMMQIPASKSASRWTSVRQPIVSAGVGLPPAALSSLIRKRGW